MDLPNNVRTVLGYVTDFSKEILKDDLVGIYLFGSLTYDDYNPLRSDLDLMVVIKERPDEDTIGLISNKYMDLAIKFPDFNGRVECSFTPIYMLNQLEPPAEGRVYFGEQFYANANYGNEWIINNYLIREYGLTIMGLDFKTLTPEINMSQVQHACLEDLQKEWLPKANDDSYLSNPHYKSYLILNLCRIIYTLKRSKAGSKTEAGNWVIATYPEFQDLVEEALAWTYGASMDRRDEIKSFIELIAREAGLN